MISGYSVETFTPEGRSAIVCHGESSGTAMTMRTGLAVALQQPMIVNDVASDPRHNSAVDDMTTVQTKSIMVVPLVSPEAEFGALTAINSKAATGFSSADLQSFCEASEGVLARLVELGFDPEPDEPEADVGDS